MPNNREKYIQTEHLMGDLRRRSIHGGTVTLASQLIKFGIRFISTIVLARLLTPNDYGLVGMVTAIIIFITMAKDLGLSMATVQKDNISHEQVSSMFWINVLLGIGFTIIVLLLAPLISRFYNEPRLVGITMMLSVGFFFAGLTVQHQALLRRQMQYIRLSIMEISAMFLASTLAIAFALSGAGYWSIVALQILNSLFIALGAWLLCGWRPGAFRIRTGISSMLAFGSFLTGFNLLNYFSRNLDNILIGKVWGTVQLGHYSKAYEILLLPINQINMPITTVAVPALSRLQDEPDRYRRYYTKAVRIVSYLTFPFILFLGVIAEDLILVLLGEQWGQAGRLFKVLAFAALFQPLMSTSSWIYISMGKTRNMFFWGLVSAPLIVASFFIGLPWGAYGISVSYAICNYLLLIPCFYFVLKVCPVSLSDLVYSTYRPLITGVIIAATVFLFLLLLSPQSPQIRVAIASLVAAFVATVLYLLWPGVREDIHFMLGFIKDLKGHS